MFKKPYHDLIGHKVVLIRLGGEMGIKSRRTRRRMTSILLRNIRNLLTQMGIKADQFEFRGRLILVPSSLDDIEYIIELITKNISGISSVSPTTVIGSNEDEIISFGAEFAKEILLPGNSFAVRSRREGKHTYSSMEIAAKLGEAIIEAKISGIKVDLSNPDQKIFLDIRDHLTFIYDRVLPGIDGIPSLSQGTLVALIRPNLNSVLAAWLMKKRGVKVIPYFFRTGKSSEEVFIKFVEESISSDVKLIGMDKFFEEFSGKKDLCLKCQLFCERVCQINSENLGLSSFISPTCFNFNDENISLEALKLLEKQSSIPVLRPIQLGFFGKRFDDKLLDDRSCCNFCEKVDIKISIEINETEIKDFIDKNY